ncbi:hypothetical protein MUK72_18725 (plasmid) [Halococcus dombrowskii]|uniref:Restriction endonuclease n=1 Tax=Halococcus dombrowskii TaxID=179637 RepID=A0AAV3SGE1_HALDO|nr:hypothetical protein [Halococcus dombrowskii]UOO97500.1 hypothetical protein MUK72_18725 [Halococcus dombrowskii]
MTDVRVPVGREADSALCCPRCVALDGYDEAPDLTASVDEYEIPTAAVGEPRPERETVLALGRYCDEHDVFLVASYGDLADEWTQKSGKWIAVPLHTATDQPIAVPIRLDEMLGGSE